MEWSIFGVGGIDLVGLEWENGRFWGWSGKQWGFCKLFVYIVVDLRGWSGRVVDLRGWDANMVDLRSWSGRVADLWGWGGKVVDLGGWSAKVVDL